MKSIMEEANQQMLTSKMYDAVLNTAAKIGTTVASKPIGQMLLDYTFDYTEKCLWMVEKSVQWCMLHEQKPENKNGDVSSNEVKEPAATISSEKPEATVEAESEVVRPLPWVLLLPLLVCLKAAKTSIDVCSYVLHRESLEPSSIVEFIHTRRNLLKEIKDQMKNDQNQEEEKIKDQPSDDLSGHAKSIDKPEKQEIKQIEAIPEKEITMERKTETEATVALPDSALHSETESHSEASTVLVPSDKSSLNEENAESDNGNDSSSTLEASLTEKEVAKEETKEEDEDFQSVKSSSTYFTPDSSYSLQSVNEEPKAGVSLETELENDTQDPPSIAAAIEDLRTLSVTEAQLTTPTSSLSSSTSSVKLTESSRKRTSLSSFFQRRKAT